MTTPPAHYQMLASGVWKDLDSPVDELDMLLPSSFTTIELVSTTYSFCAKRMEITFKGESKFWPVRRITTHDASRDQFAYWRNEEGLHKFEQGVDAFLEYVHSCGVLRTAVYIQGVAYDIDMERMTQTNRFSGTKRDIVLRAFPPEHCDKLVPLDFTRIDDIPDDFVCKLTQAPFQRPVVASDGNTYEEEAIRKWINMCIGNNQPVCSPLTKKPIKNEVYLNLTLRRAMVKALKDCTSPPQKPIVLNKKRKSPMEKAQEAYDSANSSSAPGAPKKATPVVSRLDSAVKEEEEVRKKRLQRFDKNLVHSCN